MKSLVKEVLSKTEIREPVAVSPITAPEDEELMEVLKKLKTNIKVVGCGGAGSNTISRIMEEGIVDVELIAANTDAQHLLITHAHRKVLLGKRITRGLGAGALPQIGEEAAREAEDKIREVLQGADIVFITCGLGGGTGTGSAPVVAQIAKELGALTIAICTLPFKAEGKMREENAMWGLEKLKEYVDTVITIPNDKLLELVPRLPLNLAFKVADEILMRAIKGLAEMITKPGLVNLDFNDLKTIMKGGGVAMIGLGESDSENRAEDAIKEALHSPLIEADISEATGALINVIGGENMTVKEAESVAEYVQKQISEGARIIWGASIDPSLGNTLRVMIVVTGVKSPYIQGLESIEKTKEIEVIK
ncbi:MAG: cell division protein FtsZ [Thermoplasmata archaeon]|nr:cell division protein FtsZ [Thermoplasmata archaeon]